MNKSERKSKLQKICKRIRKLCFFLAFFPFIQFPIISAFLLYLLLAFSFDCRYCSLSGFLIQELNLQLCLLLFSPSSPFFFQFSTIPTYCYYLSNHKLCFFYDHICVIDSNRLLFLSSLCLPPFFPLIQRQSFIICSKKKKKTIMWA